MSREPNSKLLKPCEFHYFIPNQNTYKKLLGEIFKNKRGSSLIYLNCSSRKCGSLSIYLLGNRNKRPIMKNIFFYQTDIGKIGIVENENVITNLTS